ncbi:MAG: hypothetical protein K5669_01215 [Lachnospiraceae bacterium]|nr:hypothetical protein [Lachnospiraceae bacterium]
MNDNYVAKQIFMKAMEKIGAEGVWNERDNGSLSTEEHCGKLLDTFNVVVEFSEDEIIVTTKSRLGVEKNNRKRTDTLLKSIDEIIPCGEFFVNEDKLITFSVRCGFNHLDELENPFDLIAYGANMFEKYTETILKTLLGANMYYLKM